MTITIEHASKNYGDFVALQNITLTIPDGSLTALLGPSGSGKSTLLRAIAGLDLLDSGHIVINGVDVTRATPQQRDIGFVFQHYAAFKHMTVRENIAFGLQVRKRPKAEIKEKVNDLLSIVGLVTFQNRYPAQLSGGQRQRMALARALAVDPRILLLDEPFGALDAKVRDDLRVWLRRLHQEMNVTTILVTHDQHEALDIADQIAVMNKGRLEQVGSPEEVYDYPSNDFVMGFLGSVSTIGGLSVRPHDIRVACIAHDLESVGEGNQFPIIEATVERVVYLGFEVRIELKNIANGENFFAQVTRGTAEALRLDPGDLIYARATRFPRTVP